MTLTLVCQESVAAAYGSGTETACVVDVGHQTTSVCCVENGFQIPESRLNFPCGSDDINHLVQWLLRRVESDSMLQGFLPNDSSFPLWSLIRLACRTDAEAESARDAASETSSAMALQNPQVDFLF
jgi:actin-related protein